MKHNVILCFVIFLILLAPLFVFASAVINEIAWAGTTDGWRYEWVELFNSSGGTIDVSGWQIDNGASSNKTLVLSSGIIPANGYFLVCRKEMTVCDVIETKLSLHNEYNKNGKLVLRNSAGNVVDSTPEPEGKLWPGGDNETKQTMERIAGGWQTSQSPNGTPKSENGRSSTPSIDEPAEPKPEPVSLESDESESDFGAPLKSDSDSSDSDRPEPEPSPLSPLLPLIPPIELESPLIEHKPIEYPSNIFINEILPSPEGADSEYEWLELYNSNNFEVDLSGWQLIDKVGAVRTYTCPNNTKIMSYNFLLIPRTKSKITLQNSGDGLELLNPNKEIVYSVDYPKAPKGQSYNRTEEIWAWSTTLTPEKQNIVTQPALATPETLLADQLAQAPASPEKTAGHRGTDVSANVGSAMPETSKHIITLIFAVIIAIGSGVIVVLLKKKQEK